MLIKYYEYSNNPVQDLHIIENVENVTVHGGIFQAFEHGPDIEQVQNHLFFDKDQLIKQENNGLKLITFRQNSVTCRLSVYGTAYICNNEGDTVEKVDPIR